MHETSVLLGLDLMKPLGIKIQRPNPFVIRGRNDIFSEAMNKSIEATADDKYQMQIRNAVAAYLAENIETSEEFCTLPAAVNIKLQGFSKSDAKPIRQYTIPFSL